MRDNATQAIYIGDNRMRSIQPKAFKMKKPYKMIISIIVLWCFLFSLIFSDIAWALRPAATHIYRETDIENAIVSARQAFSNPQKYRELILKRIKINPLEQFIGKATAYVFLTRFCPIRCSHCYFTCPYPTGEKTQEDAFTPEGITKLIEFLNDANMGYLSITGAEPFLELEAVYKIVEEIQSDIITLVTSGFWAKNDSRAREIVDNLYAAFKRRKHKAKVILRISVDEGHVKELGMQPPLNLINIFQERFKDEDNFELKIRSIIDEPTVDNLLAQLPVKRVADTGEIYREGSKTHPRKKEVELQNGFRFTISYEYLFYSDKKVDLNNERVVERNLEVIDKDIDTMFKGNTAIAHNPSGEKGFLFCVDFDGRAWVQDATLPDNMASLYKHGYRDIINRVFEDVIAVSYIEKGNRYREAIINEVNPKAVIRSKAVNIRDYVSSIMLEEEKTRLYLAIRVLQDYIQEGRISQADTIQWPEEIRHFVSLDRGTLIQLYHESDYSIVIQYLEKIGISTGELADLYELLILGHYDVSPDAMIEIIEGTNALNKSQKKEFFTKIGFQGVESMRRKLQKGKNIALLIGQAA